MPIAYKAVLIYAMAVNLAAFFAFGMDKSKAKKSRRRVPEQILFAYAFLGGSVGAAFGMVVFHHKTRKRKFSLGIPVILAVQLGAVYFLLRYI